MRFRDVMTKSSFALWLDVNSNKKVFTFSEKLFHGESCPIARYLQRQGYTDVFVNENGIQIGEKTYNIPRWANKFITEFDRYIGYDGDLIISEVTQKKSVTGKVVLKILEGTL